MGRSASELGEGHRQHPIERRAVIVYVVLAEHIEIRGVYYGGRDLSALLYPGD